MSDFTAKIQKNRFPLGALPETPLEELQRDGVGANNRQGANINYF